MGEASRATEGGLRKRVEAWCAGRAFFAAGVIARSLPAGSAMPCGDLLGDTLFRLCSRHRQVAIRNLSYVFGSEWRAEEIERTARLTFRQFGRGAVEFFRLPGLSPAKFAALASYQGRDHLDGAFQRGRGVILLSAHFGNWEIMAAKLVADGYPLTAVARDADDPFANRIINGIREQRGIRVLSRGRSARAALEVLRRNELLVLLADQNSKDGIFVPFFGRLAGTATGPAALARATGATIVPCFTVRQPNDTHVLQMLPPLPFRATDDKQKDILQLTTDINKIIEAAIKRDPTLWLWFHNRWKFRPPQEAAGSQAFEPTADAMAAAQPLHSDNRTSSGPLGKT